MNNFIKISVIVSMMVALVACHYDIGLGNHDNDYLGNDQSMPLLNVPANSHLDTSAMNKTALPAFDQNAAKVSIYPPDTLITNTEKPRPPLPRITPQAPVKSSQPHLLIHRDLKRSWVMVGTALKKSGYRILSQDQIHYRFYILDARGKGRALNNSSPIYFVQLEEKGAKLTTLIVMAKDNQPAPEAIAQDILNNIAAKLR